MSKKDVNEVLNDVQEAAVDAAQELKEDLADIANIPEKKNDNKAWKYVKKGAGYAISFGLGIVSKVLWDYFTSGSDCTSATGVVDNIVEMPAAGADVKAI